EGGPFEEAATPPADPRAVSLKAQLDEMDKAMRCEPHRLATIQEALHVQELIEAMLLARQKV
ncbi:MAG: gfo/Idh/MocA family oxidoreductase, partial [Pseudomonadota bacterium]